METTRRSVHYSSLLLAASFAAFLVGCPQDNDYFCDAPSPGSASASCYACDGAGCRAIAAPTRTACTCDYQCGAAASDCTSLGCTQTCSAMSPCAQGTTCRNGLCLHPSEAAPTDLVCACTQNSQCDTDGTGRTQCVNGACVTNPNGCSATSPCSNGQVCVSGQCREVNNTCRFSSECGAGRVCVNSTCNVACNTTTSPCSAGLRCNASGFCEVDPTSMTCANDAACGAGNICVDQRCYAGCTGDSQCTTSGTYCYQGRCIVDDRPNPSCNDTNKQCASGSVCRNGTCRSPCQQAQECPRFDVQLQFCIDSVCATSNEQTSDCSKQEDCRSGQNCVDGVCR